MMVDRRHLENPLLAQFEAAHLEDDRHRLHHEHAADDDEQQFLLGADGRGAERAADGQRTGIAHEHLRRMAVEPEEPEARPDQCHEKHRQLADVAVVGNDQILGGHVEVTGQIGEDRVGKRHADRRPGRQPVEPVG